MRSEYWVVATIGVIATYLAGRLVGPLAATVVSGVWIGLTFWTLENSQHLIDDLMILTDTDDLTGLRNSRAFKFDPTVGQLSMILFDIDDFKSFNDSFGHLAGDEALREIGKLLEGSPTVYRLGGDEFAILLGDRDAESIREVAGAIQNQFRLHPWKCKPLRASFGIAMMGPSRQMNELRDHADRALYQAKREGGDRICFYSDDEIS